MGRVGGNTVYTYDVHNMVVTVAIGSAPMGADRGCSYERGLTTEVRR